MRKFFTGIALCAVLLVSAAGCTNTNSSQTTSNMTSEFKESESEVLQETDAARDVMPDFQAVGVANSVYDCNVATDGRWIFYTYFSGTDNCGKLYRMKMDGSDKEELGSSENRKYMNLYCADGYFYYAIQGEIYRIDISTPPDYMDLHSTNRILSREEDGGYFAEEFFQGNDKYLYVIIHYDEMGKSGVYQIAPDTLEKKLIYPGVNLSLQVCEDALYIGSKDDGMIYEVSLDGSEVTGITELYGQVGSRTLNYVVYDGWLYQEYVENNKTHYRRIQIETGVTEPLMDLGVSCSPMNAMDGSLYYINFDFGSANTYDYQICRYEIESQKLTILYSVPNALEALWTIDNQIYFSENMGSNIWNLSCIDIDTTDYTVVGE